MSAATENGTIQHVWFKPNFLKFDCCRACGVVRRADDKNSPCKGNVKITLRALVGEAKAG